MTASTSLRTASSSLLRSVGGASASASASLSHHHHRQVALIRPVALACGAQSSFPAIARSPSSIRHASSSSSSSSSSSQRSDNNDNNERSPYTSVLIGGSIAISFVGYLIYSYTSSVHPEKRGAFSSRMKNVVGGARTILRKATGDDVEEEAEEEEELKEDEEEESAKASETDPLANAGEPNIPGGSNEVSSLDPIAKVVSEDVGPNTEEGTQAAAFNPATGEINWDCPCLGGMASGPCGEEFKEAFACFVYSEKEPKGIECVDRFSKMQECFRRHPEVYREELEGDEEEDAVDGLIAEAEHALGYPPLGSSNSATPAAVGTTA